MSSKKFTLYDPFKIDLDLVKEQQFAQRIIYYGELRFRSILISYNQADIHKKMWMTKYIHKELVRCISLVYKTF